MNIINLPISLGEALDKLTNIKSDWLWSFKMQADNFVDTILNNKKSICSGEDTINDLSLIEKIWKKF